MPTFATPEPLAVTIEIVVGDARITASDRSDTVVEVHPSDPTRAADVEAAANTRIDHHEGRLHVRAPKPWRRFSPFDNGGSVSVVAEVPTGSSVEADTSLGDLHAEGELGTCRFKSAMGHIRLDQVGSLVLKTSYGNAVLDRAVGDIDVHTGSGDVRIGEVDGSAVIKNSNGPTHIGAVTGDLRVKAANGEISVERALRSVVAKSANGAIRVGAVTRGVVVLETSAGEVACGVAEGTAAWLDVRSQHGQVRNRLETAQGPEGCDETVEIRGRTAIGDIVIHRAGTDPH